MLLQISEGTGDHYTFVVARGGVSIVHQGAFTFMRVPEEDSGNPGTRYIFLPFIEVVSYLA